MTAMNLASMLSRTAERSGDRPAVRLGEATMTYRELDETSARVAGLLGDRRATPR
jgi:long-chain acyl-CoA synthetase